MGAGDIRCRGPFRPEGHFGQRLVGFGRAGGVNQHDLYVAAAAVAQDALHTPTYRREVLVWLHQQVDRYLTSGRRVRLVWH